MDYPDRVTLCEDGVYRWRYTLSREQAKEHFHAMIGISLAVTTVIALIMFALIGTQVLLYLLILYAMMVGLPALIGWLTLGWDTRCYEMDDEYIRHKHATKGGDAFIGFKRIKDISVDKNAFWIKSGITTYTVYVPPEDMAFMKSYIQEWLK